MKYIVCSVQKFTYKDKTTKEDRPSVTVFGLDEKGTTMIPLFFDLKTFNEKWSVFDSLVLDKADVDNLFKDYKSCSLDFDQKGRLVQVTE